MTAVPRVIASCTTSPVPPRPRGGSPSHTAISMSQWATVARPVITYASRLAAGYRPGSSSTQLARSISASNRSRAPSLARLARYSAASKRQHYLQLPAELQRDLGGNLVGAVGDRRHEPQLQRDRSEAILLLAQQRLPRIGDEQQNFVDLSSSRSALPFGKLSAR